MKLGNVEIPEPANQIDKPAAVEIEQFLDKAAERGLDREAMANAIEGDAKALEIIRSEMKHP